VVFVRGGPPQRRLIRFFAYLAALFGEIVHPSSFRVWLSCNRHSRNLHKLAVFVAIPLEFD